MFSFCYLNDTFLGPLLTPFLVTKYVKIFPQLIYLLLSLFEVLPVAMGNLTCMILDEYIFLKSFIFHEFKYFFQIFKVKNGSIFN
jgi:hypothetical protein